MSKSVLIETSLFQPVSSLVENRGGSGNMVVEGILTTVNQENGNSRVYPKELWEREMDKYSQLIKENRALGELDHPESSIIAGDRISHNIIETWWENKTLMGKIKILTITIISFLLGFGYNSQIPNNYLNSLSDGWHNVQCEKRWYDDVLSKPTKEDCELIIKILRGDFDIKYSISFFTFV